MKRMQLCASLFIVLSLCLSLITTAQADTPPPQVTRWSKKMGLVNHLGGINNALVLDDATEYAYASQGPRVTVLDIHDPEAGENEWGHVHGFRTSPPFPGNIRKMALKGTVLYLAAEDAGVIAVDVAGGINATLRTLWTYDTSTYAMSVAVAGNRLYTGSSGEGLFIFDITNPAAPVLLQRFDNGKRSFLDLHVVGAKVYIAADADGLLIYDTTNLNSIQAYQSDLGRRMNGIKVVGSYAYIATDEGLLIMDISNPANIFKENEVLLDGNFVEVDVVNDVVDDSGYDMAYLANSMNGVCTVNVSHPSQPSTICTRTYTVTLQYAYGVIYRGGYLYTAFSGGMRILDEQTTAPGLKLNGGYLQDVGEIFDVAYFEGITYIAGADGLMLYDPSSFSPVRLLRAITLSKIEVGRIGDQLIVFGVYGGKVVAYNVTNPDAIPPIITLNVPTGSGFTQEMELSGTLLVIAVSNPNQIITVDVANPASPVVQDTEAVPGAPLSLDVHRWMTITIPRVTHRVAAVTYSTGFTYFDLDDPTAISVKGSVSSSKIAWDAAIAAATFPSPAVPQALYVAYDDGIVIYNPADLSAPAGTYDSPLITRHVLVKDGYLYVGAREGTVEALDIRDRFAPRQYGYYDLPSAYSQVKAGGPNEVLVLDALGGVFQVVVLEQGTFLPAVRK